MDWDALVCLLADAEEKAPLPGGEFMMIVPFVIILVFYFVFVQRHQRKEQESHKSMLAALKKNDKVQTIGGIIGSVANVSPDGQEVTLKVDDNTRIKFIRSAIQKVVAQEGEAAKPAESK
jgi:preprotein translocase subunit YajC